MNYISLSEIIAYLIVFIIFMIPIITDFLVLRKYASTHDTLFYTIGKIALYIAYPFFIIYFLDFIKVSDPNAGWSDFTSPDALNQDVVEYVAWFLLVGGMTAILVAKYKLLNFFQVRNLARAWSLLLEIFYIPFILGALLIALW